MSTLSTQIHHCRDEALPSQPGGAGSAGTATGEVATEEVQPMVAGYEVSSGGTAPHLLLLCSLSLSSITQLLPSCCAVSCQN